MASASSVARPCQFGTGYAYNSACNPNGSAACTYYIKNLSGTGCGNGKWGWYFALTPASLAAFSAPLYVGAGGNNLASGTAVGTVSITTSGSAITVHYTVDPAYGLNFIHVQLDCDVPPKCSPGQLNSKTDGTPQPTCLIGANGLPATSTSVTFTKTCTTYYAIFHAAVDRIDTTGTDGTCTAADCAFQDPPNSG